MNEVINASQQLATQIPQISTALVTVAIILVVTGIALAVARFIINNMRPS